MDDLALGNNSNKFINALFDDEVPLPSNNEAPGYAGIKGLLSSLGIDLNEININIEGTQKIGDVLKTVTSSAFLIGALAPIISEILGRDSYFRDCCSAAKNTDRIRIQSSELNLASKPKINTNSTRISYFQNFIIERIIAFFVSLSNKMNAMRAEREKAQGNVNIIGKTNIAQNVIAFLGGEPMSKFANSINGGFTVLGITVNNNINLSSMKKQSKDEDPKKLELNSTNLKNLKDMREQAFQASLEQNPQLLQQQGYSMKMRPLGQKGFTSTASLLIFMSILITITEFALIIYGFYK